MNINVSRLHYPVTALGPGRRAGIWVQGCTIGCPGCVSRDTWDRGTGTQLDVVGVLEWFADTCRNTVVDGLTISGGEPAEQSDALRLLLSGIDELRSDRVFTGDVLCYTGLDEADFHATLPWAAQLIDAVITGPFRITEPTTLLWRGSANQRLIPISERGERVYRHYLNATTDRPDIQFTVSEGQVWMIGIPRRGDLQQLEAALRTGGVALEEVSWRPR